MSHTTVLPAIAGVFFTAGLLTLVFLLVQILRNARQSDRERRYQVTAWRSDLKRGLAVAVGLGIIGLANSTFWCNNQLKLYASITSGLPMGVISVLRTDENLHRLVYSTLDDAGRETFEIFPVHDAAFRIYGERIRWSQHLGALGLGDFFKVTQIEFLPPSGAMAVQAPSSRIEVRKGSTRLFAHLAGASSWLPFVEVEAMSTPTYDAGTEFAGQLLIDSTGLALR